MAVCLRTLLRRQPLCSAANSVVLPSAGFQKLTIPKQYDDAAVAPDKQGARLPFLAKVPQFTGKPPLYTRSRHLVRGLETIHNEFQFGEYGIIALQGGWLTWGHILMIQNTLNRNLDPRREWVSWRIDSPWYPRTKKGIGVRMGGGRPNIKGYEVPVKEDRIIVEMGGRLSMDECKQRLRQVARLLPFKAEAISKEQLANKRRIRKVVEQANTNPYKYKYIIQNNFFDCHRWTTRGDRTTFGRCV